jgi:hypothetical protein
MSMLDSETFVPAYSQLRPLTEDERREVQEGALGLSVRTPQERETAYRERIAEQGNIFLQALQLAEEAGALAGPTKEAVEGLREGGTARERAGRTALSAAQSAGTFAIELPIETLLGGATDVIEDTINTTIDFMAYVQDIPAAREALARAAAMTAVPTQGAGEALLVRQRLLATTPTEIGHVDPFDIPDPTTKAGKFARDLTSFAVALVPAARAIRTLGMGTRVAGAGRIAKGAVGMTENVLAFGLASGITIDPASERLSDMLVQYPELQNPVTEYLATSGDESAAEARVKNAFEGMAVGVAFESFMLPLRAFKRFMRPSSPATKEAIAAEVQAREVSASQFDAATQEARKGGFVLAEGAARPGQPQRPLLPPRPASATGASFQSVRDSIAAIDTTAADALVGAVERARGATTDQAVLRAASKIKTSTLLRITPGSTNITLAQERALQARREILEVFITEQSARMSAIEVAGKDISKQDLAYFAQMRNLYTEFSIRHQPVVSDAARKLRIQQQPVFRGKSKVNLEEIAATLTDTEASAIIETSGGRDLLRELAHKTSMLAGPDEVHAYWNALSKGQKLNEVTRYLWYQGLLSGTAIVKALVGNAQYTQQLAIERAIAQHMPSASLSLAPARRMVTSTLTGETIPDLVVRGEAATFTMALLDSIGGAIRVGSRALTEPAFETVAARSRLGTFRVNPFRMVAETQAQRGAAVRSRWMHQLATLTELPTRGLVGLDDATQALVAGAHVRSVALREATVRGLDGAEARQFIKEYIYNPPNEVLEAAVQMGKEAGLRQALPVFAQGIETANQNIVGALLAPFLRPGINRLALLIERSPLALFSPSVRADLIAGGARAQMAEAKILSGLMVILAGMDLAHKGVTTGRMVSRTGGFAAGELLPPDNSYITKDGTYESYGPDTLAGFALSVGNDLYRYSHVFQNDTLDLSDKGIAILVAAARIGSDEVALRDVTKVLGTIYDGRSLRAAGNTLARMGESTVATFVTPQALKIAGTLAEPESKELNTLWDRVIDRVGIEGGFPRRDIHANPMTKPNPFYHAIPFIFSAENLTGSVENEYMRLTVANGRFPLRKVRKTMGDARGELIELNPRQYDRLQVIAGIELDKRNVILDVISSPEYATLPPDEQAARIQAESAALNELARGILLGEEEQSGDPDGLIAALLNEEARRLGQPPVIQ